MQLHLSQYQHGHTLVDRDHPRKGLFAWSRLDWRFRCAQIEPPAFLNPSNRVSVPPSQWQLRRGSLTPSSPPAQKKRPWRNLPTSGRKRKNNKKVGKRSNFFSGKQRGKAVVTVWEKHNYGNWSGIRKSATDEIYSKREKRRRRDKMIWQRVAIKRESRKRKSDELGNE